MTTTKLACAAVALLALTPLAAQAQPLVTGSNGPWSWADSFSGYNPCGIDVAAGLGPWVVSGSPGGTVRVSPGCNALVMVPASGGYEFTYTQPQFFAVNANNRMQWVVTRKTAAANADVMADLVQQPNGGWTGYQVKITSGGISLLRLDDNGQAPVVLGQSLAPIQAAKPLTITFSQNSSGALNVFNGATLVVQATDKTYQFGSLGMDAYGGQVTFGGANLVAVTAGSF